MPHRSAPIMLPRTSQALYLVQRIRDEAHRFAITYHRDGPRASGRWPVVLDDVAGIGPTRKKALLKRFGSVRRIREASVEEVAETPGVNRELAERLKSTWLARGCWPERDRVAVARGRSYNRAARRFARRVSCLRALSRCRSASPPSGEDHRPKHDLASHRPLGDPCITLLLAIYIDVPRDWLPSTLPGIGSKRRCWGSTCRAGSASRWRSSRSRARRSATPISRPPATSSSGASAGSVSPSRRYAPSSSQDGSRASSSRFPASATRTRSAASSDRPGQLQFIDPKAQTLTEQPGHHRPPRRRHHRGHLRRRPDRAWQRCSEQQQRAAGRGVQPQGRRPARSLVHFTTTHVNQPGPIALDGKVITDAQHPKCHLRWTNDHHRRHAGAGRPDRADEPLQHAALRRAAGRPAGGGRDQRWPHARSPLPGPGVGRRRSRPAAGPVLHDRLLPAAGRTRVDRAGLLHPGDLRDLPDPARSP